ncbi:GntR family transcriptional regulator [uncultured Tateyamaria sp.]|uniref:GntR family transcriptional regulator n=1 Tax=uncultured Tateyamaria sp. TaxID=455651 RepID=UPI00263637DE|nr:GntR family transcriptional regulator [uncultured Tateyamaria sp.]
MIRRATNAKNTPVVAAFSDHLRRDICLGLLRPGTRLNIEALKREHDISHPSVREALSLLVGEGYVISDANRGFTVAETSLDEQRDSTRVRAELEAMAFEWSVQNTTTDWRASVVACHYALTQIETKMIEDPVAHALEWDDRNRAFHFSLIANCGSAKLLEIIGTLYDHSKRYRLAAHAHRSDVSNRKAWIAGSSREHGALKDAALSGNVALGRDVLNKHITKAMDEMPDTLRALQSEKTGKVKTKVD